jgi:hypothetical protein
MTTIGKGYVYTDLSRKGVLTLTIDGKAYEVAQFSMAFACNEVPVAVCLLATGRNARTLKAAQINREAISLKQMLPATVTFSPAREYDQHVDWPAGPRTIFDGFFTGIAFRKVYGKITAVANLVHWTAALGFSSCVTALGHPGNPTQFTYAAVSGVPNHVGAAANYTSLHSYAQLLGVNLTDDVWGSIKDMFCELANLPATVVGRCSGDGVGVFNNAALAALSRFEGGSNDCALDRIWSKQLAMVGADVGGIIGKVMAEAISNEALRNYTGTTFWDKLVLGFCPMFGMAVVPLVDTALVIADTPALGAVPGDQEVFPVWKNIPTTDYDSIDMSAELHHPLRGVATLTDWEAQTFVNVENRADLDLLIGGCFIADSVEPGDGVMLYVPPPPWLQMLKYQPEVVTGSTDGLTEGTAGKTATTPLDPPGGAHTVGIDPSDFYNRYSHLVYVSHMLRGRNGTLSGKLRFDIAPGSIIQIQPKSELHLGGEDALAVPLFACVSRVTCTINAEAGAAGTAFDLSHVRTLDENTEARSMVTEHPLFGDAIHGRGGHGAPLIDDYNLD